MPVSDPRDETWSRFRIAILSALLKRKGLVASPGAIATAAAEDSVGLAWKRLSVLATRTHKFRWLFWGHLWGR